MSLHCQVIGLYQILLKSIVIIRFLFHYVRNLSISLYKISIFFKFSLLYGFQNKMNCVPESCPCKKIGFPNCVTNCIKRFYIYIYIYRILYIYNIRYHPPSSTLLASAIAFNKYPHTINRTFCKGLVVPNYYLFLLKNQNINAIQK